MNKINEFLILAKVENVLPLFIDVKKKGNLFMGLCPFHEDINPSLVISKEKQIWKCFVCNLGGNSINFVQKFKKTNFVNAVEIICNKLNISNKFVHNYSTNYSDEQKQIIELNNEALNFYKYNLFVKNATSKDKPVIYLKNRDINKNTAKFYQLGYADKNNSLKEYFLKKNINLDNCVSAGLLNISNNKYNDYFKNRIIFPIYNFDNILIGFSGRTIDDNNIKYLNSKTNSIFNKKNIIYNFSNLKDNKINSIFILEGLFDLMSLYQRCNINGVAFLGIDYNPNNILKIISYSRDIVLGLDNDKAGIDTTINLLISLLKNNIYPKILDYGKYKDINEYITNNKQFNNIKDIEINIYDFIFKKYWNIKDNDEEKNLKFKKIINIIKYEKNIVTLNKNINILSQITEIDKSFILEKIDPNRLVDNNQDLESNNENLKEFINKTDTIIEIKILIFLLKINSHDIFKILYWFRPRNKDVRFMLTKYLENSNLYDNLNEFEHLSSYNYILELLNNKYFIENELKDKYFIQTFKHHFFQYERKYLKSLLINDLSQTQNEQKFIISQELEKI